MSWEVHIAKEWDRHDWEPKYPDDWTKVDRLLPFARQSDAGRLDERIGWAFAAWTRLPYEHRVRAMLERAIVAELLNDGSFRRFDGFYAVGVQSLAFFRGKPMSFAVPELQYFFPADYVAVINVTTPMAPEIVGTIKLESDEVFDWLLTSNRSVPVIVQYLSPPVSFSQISNATETSGSGPPPPIHSSDVLSGTSPAGLQSRGLVTSFARDGTSLDPRLLASAHVLGGIGSTVVASGHKIGQVVNVDQQLDSAVVELDDPWAVDYRVRTLGVVPAAPVMQTASMNIQYVDQSGIVQVGYVWQSILWAPGQATIGVTPHFTCSFQASGGDSGGLIMTGHQGVSAMGHYAGVTSPGVLDMYRCAMLGHVLGGAGGGPASVPAQTIGIPITEVLASLNLDPLHR